MGGKRACGSGEQHYRYRLVIAASRHASPGQTLIANTEFNDSRFSVATPCFSFSV
jgi:hypothetical protein